MEGSVLLFQLGLALLIMLVGLLSGTWVERRHYRSIERREAVLRDIPTSTRAELPDASEVLRSRIVCGSAVVSIDAFKQALARLQRFFGGEVTAYETLVDRARREALLRLLRPRSDLRRSSRTCDIETSPRSAGGGGERVTSIEVLGTTRRPWS